MFQILYTSEARVSFSPGELTELLAAARRRNERVGVTGMLLFCRGHFLQMLEGDARDVIATFERIEKDGRHAHVTTLYRGHSPVGRAFAEWSMGFHRIEGPEDAPPGFVRINDRLDLAQFDHVAALDFLTACQRRPALS